MARKRKPALIHVQLSSVVGLVRRLKINVSGSAFNLGREPEYALGARDAVHELLALCREVWGDDFKRAWEATDALARPDRPAAREQAVPRLRGGEGD